jgi:predicted Rossmann fold nucleotide-binding protein DprA/Smf involved in DNA uptake
MDAGQPYDLDALAAGSGLATGELLSRLSDLELRGLIHRAGSGRFVRRG